MAQRTDRALLLTLLFITIPVFSSFLSTEKSTSFLSSTSTPLPSDATPQYQPLPILRDDSGLYYINVTWKNSSVHPYYSDQDISLPSDFQDDPSMNNGKMVLSFYTNLSFVSVCQDFLPYECSSLDCQINNLNEIDSSFLYDGTEIEGYSIGLGIESSAFNMCGYSAILASTCGYGFPEGISGFLGFGFSLNAFFDVNRNFSIFLSDGNDGLNSTLFIGPDNDQDLIDMTSNFQQSWNTDTNWTVNVIGASAQVEGKPGSFKAGIGLAEGYRALFDINTDAIGMPAVLFNNLTSVLQSYGVNCNASPYQPSCTYSGDITSLPTFYFDLDNNQSAIEIKPQVYFVQSPDEDTSYTLMFAAMASGIPGALQVSPQYNTSIILGRPFMTFYYVHFSLCEDYIQPYITLFYANHNVTTQQSNTKMILIICGASLAFVLLVVAIVCIIIRRKKRNSHVFKIEDGRATIDTYTWTKKDIESLNKNEGSNLKQPLVNHSMSSDGDRKSRRSTKKKVWSNEGFVDPNEINAFTYQKQKYRGLYESECDSFSLNNDIEVESH